MVVRSGVFRFNKPEKKITVQADQLPPGFQFDKDFHGLVIESERTGKRAQFYQAGTRKFVKGIGYIWMLRPTPKAELDFPHLEGYTLVVTASEVAKKVK